MLGNITHNNGIYFNSIPGKNKVTKDKKYELFATNQHEKTAEIKKSANFLDIPQETLNIIGDFIGKKDILNKMLPLSKKIFEAVIEDRFKLRITTHDGQILEIGYKQFLSNRILILKERIENDPRHGRSPLATWKKLHYTIATMRNLPNSLYQNYSPANNIAFATLFISIDFEAFIYILEKFKPDDNQDILFEDIKIRAHIVALIFTIISFSYFIIKERINPHLLPSLIQRNLIEQRAAAVYARQQLPKLETHFEELMALYHAQQSNF